jgi:hypothetical protein
VFRLHVLVPGENEAPDFVGLKALAVQVAHNSVLVFGARFACIYAQLNHRIDGDARYPASGADRVALD